MRSKSTSNVRDDERQSSFTTDIGGTIVGREERPVQTVSRIKSPAKNRGRQHQLALMTNVLDQDLIVEEQEDLEKTPRAHPFRVPPALPYRPRSDGDSTGSPKSSSSRGPCLSNSSSQARSPTRRMADLESSVALKPWPSNEVVPQDLKDLVKDIERLTAGKGVLPRSVKDTLADAGENMEDIVCLEGAHGSGDGNGSIGRAIFPEMVDAIVESTNSCFVQGDSEACWNAEVHDRVFHLALWRNAATPEVYYKNITTARISDASLLPLDPVRGVMSAKLVDYAMIINPPHQAEPGESAIYDAIAAKEIATAGLSINQTNAEYVHRKPLVINVETKAGAKGDVKVRIQLGTWLVAHFKRLRQLTTETAQLPSLPVLSVQGKSWWLLLATLRPSGQIHLIEGRMFGETSSVLGVYKVVAVIRRLARWIKDDYRPWFEREVLDMTPSQGS